ncbi:hypothetical protein [Croceicoccus naphthovorans]|uniref:Uncharacterized protein n=1 Tax=Croceicoccus naphthovorans TaxID=1348774 RepID=A0A0G3XF48_9SPHN|nr:hypothetical protein [Croceicoccus naphthovorans]AKM09013.1 hypothetical protein AB433_01950 [Croceicoccus naphthovorans]MBB3989168.1 hypothetical protein [Croceicoccus naphthovorans]
MNDIDTANTQGSPPPRFDAGKAWNRAMALVKANKDLLLVVAGLFFFIPQMLMTILVPQPDAGLEGEAAAQAALDIFGTWWPLILIAMVVQMLGMLAIMVVLLDLRRPTVREGIRAALKALPAYFAATLILGAGVGLFALLILVPIMLAAGQTGAALAIIPIIAIAIWVNVRTLPLGPVVAAERITNPFDALQRSWRLTLANGPRILMLVGLFLIAALVVSIVATAVPGSILIAVLGQETGGGIVGVIEALVSAVLMTMWTVLLVASYRQLAA